MQRFLARVLDEFHDGLTVKGGMALELRLDRARTTRDIDLRMTGERTQVQDRLRRVGTTTNEMDHLTFRVDENPRDPDIDGDGVIYEGFRFRALALFAGKPYGAAFGVDVAFGDPMIGRRETISAANLLSFVGAPPVLVPVYPVPTHLAEKLHAYTLPRATVNHRMKDLIDMALIASELSVDAATLRQAIETTFAFRGSHDIPPALPPPPEPWTARYPIEQHEQALPWPTLAHAHAVAAAFLDPVLGNKAAGAWEPAAQRWA